MAPVLRTCAHCGTDQFQFFPNLSLDVGLASTMLGMKATKNITPRWNFTLVVCNKCGHSQTFTTKECSVDLSKAVPGVTITQLSVKE